jgi:D-amino-acid dehydrogenase
MLGAPIMLQSGKGYSVDYSPAPVELRTSLTFDEAHIAVTGLNGMVRVAGTMEFAGMDDRIRPARVAAIKKAAAQGLRDWDEAAPQRVAWAGHRPMTPDGLPMIGPLDPGSNVTVATGHAMLGLTQAPVTGREVRDQLSGRKQADPALAVRRFGRQRQRASA